jgi:hypothetical protein
MRKQRRESNDRLATVSECATRAHGAQTGRYEETTSRRRNKLEMRLVKPIVKTQVKPA